MPTSNLNYLVEQVPGKRRSSKGRCSGGLVILYSHIFSDFRVIKSNPNWILAHFTFQKYDFILGNVYFPPNLFNSLLEEFNEDFQSVYESYPNCCLVLGGDWNARIGECQGLEEESMDISNLTNDRSSSDKVVNKEGKRFLKWVSQNGLIVVNGRCKGDIPGQFTYLSKSGASVVDLSCVNFKLASLIHEFKVEGISLLSDHFPCVLSCNLNSYYENLPPQKHNVAVDSPRWVPDFANTYQNCIAGFLREASASHGKLHEPSLAIFMDALRSSISSSCMSIKKSEKQSRCKPAKAAWFDRECRSSKYYMRSAFRLAKRNQFSKLYTDKYIELKKQYKSQIHVKKTSFLDGLEKKFLNVKNSAEFWGVVKLTNRSKGHKGVDIDLFKIESHFRLLFSQNKMDMPIFTQKTCDILDRPVSVGELKIALAKCKNKKAPGLDLISYEFYKNLPEEGLAYLSQAFSLILAEASCPKDWADIVTFLLFKKGDKKSLDNYRGISLINSISKIFFSILNSRLVSFCDIHNLLPENQCGFRGGRSCADHIFTLSSIISLYVNHKKRKLYVAFIDFKKAFDNVNHALLFSKLLALGVSSNFLKIVSSFFDNANIKVKTAAGITNPIKICNGVLQGDVLSPLLFLLFVSDFEKFCRERQLPGVYINNLSDVLALFFADDLVILADTPIDLQRKLNALDAYCNLNKLVVNAEKSKVMVFRKGGKIKNSLKFFFGKTVLEITSSYKYLGINFSSSGSFRLHSQQSVNRARVIVEGCYGTISSFKTSSTQSWRRLLDSIMLATCLYEAGIWALKFSKDLETIQVIFLKRILHLPSATPGHFLRSQCEAVKLELTIFKRMFKWWIKLLEMPANRFPKLCYLKLLDLSNRDCSPPSLDWVGVFKEKLMNLSLLDLWASQNFQTAKREQQNVFKLLENILLKEDAVLISNSAYNSFFKLVCNETKFLNLNMALKTKRTLMAIRVHYKKKFKLFFEGHIVNFSDMPCIHCNFEDSSFIHFLTSCPVSRSSREKYYSTLVMSQDQALQILSYYSTSDINNFVNFLRDAVKLYATHYA